ncbi:MULTISPECIES: radical SAM/SPASM domain-containing protein [Lacticaseibacillus]|uniref:radical SAM/SPASM domain-containing protein n=1 Tax=Lacticaseibacillus TaxID=2759736 RepID=UPI00063D8D0F|nr:MULTISPECIES: radical SAM protein [Lacticaseibacillus]KLI76527.1 hypothetical protein AAW28_04965 [Lacticaseibacillus casei]
MRYTLNDDVDILKSFDKKSARTFNKQTKVGYSLNEDAIRILEEVLSSTSQSGDNNLITAAKYFCDIGLLKESRCESKSPIHSIRVVKAAKQLKKLQIELTQKCNLRCIHCYMSETTHYLHSMNFNWLISLIDQAYDLGVEEISLTGGETLSYRHFKEVVSYISSKRFSLRIYTNGTLLRPKTVQFLKDQRVEHVKVSVDGGTKETHESIRGKGTFKSLINGLDLLKEAGIPIEITSVLHQLNDSESELMAQLAKKYGAQHFTDVFSKTGNIDQDKNLSISPERFVNSLDYKMKLIKEVPNPHFTSYCGFGESYLYVNAMGYPQLCPALTLLPEYQLPNIFQTSLKEVWERITKQTAPQCKFFSTCKYAGYCGGGCRANALLNGGSIDGPDEYSCAIYKSLESRGVKLGKE